MGVGEAVGARNLARILHADLTMIAKGISFVGEVDSVALVW